MSQKQLKEHVKELEELKEMGVLSEEDFKTHVTRAIEEARRAAFQQGESSVQVAPRRPASPVASSPSPSFEDTSKQPLLPHATRMVVPSLPKPRRRRAEGQTGSFCAQLTIIVYKNSLLMRRRWISTLFEVILPVAVFALLVLLRKEVSKKQEKATHYVTPLGPDGHPIWWDNDNDNRNYLTGSFNFHDRLRQLVMSLNGTNRWCDYQSDEHGEHGNKTWRTDPYSTDSRMLAFTPDNNETRTLAATLLRLDSGFEPFIMFFPSEQAVEAYIRDLYYGFDPTKPRLYAVVALRRWEPGLFEYAIRMNASKGGGFGSNRDDWPRVVDTTEANLHTLSRQYFEQDWNTYWNEGFVTLQVFLDQYAIRSQSGLDWAVNQQDNCVLCKLGLYTRDDCTCDDQCVVEDWASVYRTGFSVTPFPQPAFLSDPFADIMKNAMGVLFVVAYMWPVSRLVRNLVDEKETRMRDSLKMMGLTDSVFWWSWFITYFFLFFLTALLITLMTKPNVFEHSDFGPILLFFTIFAVAVFAMCSLLYTFFQRAKTAASFSPVIFVLSFIPYFVVWKPSVSKGYKLLGCFLAPTCFGLGSIQLSQYESAGLGVNYGNWNTEFENFSFALVIGMICLDACIYLLLAWYFDKVFPGEFGSPLPFYFPLQPSFWSIRCPVLRKETPPEGERRRSSDVEMGDFDSEGNSLDEPTYVEPVPAEVESKGGISIAGLVKTYGEDTEDPVCAVKGLNLKVYQNQITALLGHNGAGKSTLVGMLTGLLPPSHGDAWAFGHSIRQDMRRVRSSMGVCPQHNVLFDVLTVREHLRIFAQLKGVPLRCVNEEVDEIIADVGLVEKANAKAGTLSGGQKRKLSIAIALIGDSKMIFLDECTSGMDVYSRRAVWDLLERKKQGRVIILVTHFLDEADQLGDRIAIMADGRLRCCGSSLFLKDLYGVGYTLTVTKTDQSDTTKMISMVKRHVEDAEVVSSAARQISFRLPFAASVAFSALLEDLDVEKARSEQTVASYGLSVTTLEEVFLRVGQKEDWKKTERLAPLDEEKKEQPQSSDLSSAAFKPEGASFFRQVGALLRKRWHNTRRDRRALMFQMVLPLCITFAGLAALLLVSSHSFPDRVLSTAQYGRPNYVPTISSFPALATQHRQVQEKWALEDGIAVAVSPQGQFLMTGHVRNNQTSWRGHPRLGRAEDNDIFLMTFSEENYGFRDGASVLFGTAGQEHVSAVTTDSEGNVYVIGGTEGNGNAWVLTGNVSNVDMFVSKFEHDTLTPLWSHLTDPAYTSQDGIAITVDSNDNIIALGTTRGTIGGEQPIGGEDCFFQTFSPDGEVLSTLMVGSTTDDQCVSFALLSDDVAFVLGSMYSRYAVWRVNLKTRTFQMTQFALESNTRPVSLVVDVRSSVYADESFFLTVVKSPYGYDQHPSTVLKRLSWIDTVAEVTWTVDLPYEVSSLAVSEARPGDLYALQRNGYNYEDPTRQNYWLNFGPCVHIFDGLGGFLMSNLSYPGDPVDLKAMVVEGNHIWVTGTAQDFLFLGNFDVLPFKLGYQTDTRDEDALLYGYDLNFSITPWLQLSPDLATAFEVPASAAESDMGFSHWLLETIADYPETRYHALRCTGEHGRFNPAMGVVECNIFFNTTSTHALPIGINWFHTNMLRLLGGGKEAKIVTHNHPLPLTVSQQRQLGLMGAIVISIGFAFIPASYIAFIVKEREIHSKHLQFLAGVGSFAYWFSSWVWDQINYLLPAAGAVVLIVSMGIDELTGVNFGATVLAILLYGPSITSFTYLFSFVFKSHSTAQNVMILVYVLTGVIVLELGFFLDLIEKTKHTNYCFKFVYRLLPNYCFGEVLLNLFYREDVSIRGTVQGIWTWDTSGYAYLYMGLTSVVYFLIVLALERWSQNPELRMLCERRPHINEAPYAEDEDVFEERQRVQSGRANEDKICIEGLRKEFGPLLGAEAKVAVRDLWFGVEAGEAFGFLGLNGAGKTTTMKMLTGDLAPTAGTAHLGGFDIRSEQESLRRHIGYCPQFDALIPTLTGFETLALFARIKGIPEQRVNFVINSLLSQVGLQEYAHRLCGGYSGGNKRKLSVAVALVGSPSVLMLDEPSSGLDPTAKRALWRVITSSLTNCSLILTTHSLEEAEALCQRIAIMVSGRLRCLGSAAHLKARFGNGYQIELKVDDAHVEECRKWFEETFDSPQLLEMRSVEFFRYKIGKRDGLNDVFRELEANKERLHIVQYSCSEFSLEQVFLMFAKQDEAEQKNAA